VASVGLSQSQIASGFTTDPDVSPGGQAMAGKFLYQVQGDPAFRAGAITAVPEPSTMAFGAVAGLLGLAGLRRLRRRP
jgi:MYXO-CTERM domain-containing protein